MTNFHDRVSGELDQKKTDLRKIGERVKSDAFNRIVDQASYDRVLGWLFGGKYKEYIGAKSWEELKTSALIEFTVWGNVLQLHGSPQRFITIIADQGGPPMVNRLASRRSPAGNLRC